MLDAYVFTSEFRNDVKAIIAALSVLEREGKQLMATLADLDAEIKTDLQNAANGIIAAVQALETNLAAGVDTSAQIAEIKAIAGSLNAATTAANPPVQPAP